jgi:hypothetical protein
MDSPDGKKCAGDGETGTSGPEVAGGLDESGGLSERCQARSWRSAW